MKLPLILPSFTLYTLLFAFFISCSTEPEDCAGVAGGSAVLSGCDNMCNSTAVEDECGQCGGDNSTCLDCAGVPNGTAIEDFNGQCCEAIDLYCCGVGCIPECEVLSDIVQWCGIGSLNCVAEGSEIIDGSPAPEDILTDCGSRTVDSPEPPDSPFER